MDRIQAIKARLAAAPPAPWSATRCCDKAHPPGVESWRIEYEGKSHRGHGEGAARLMRYSGLVVPALRLPSPEPEANDAG